MKLQTMVLGLVVIIIGIINGVIFYFENRPLEFEPLQAYGIKTMVPQGWAQSKKLSKGWDAIYFKHSCSHLTLASRKLDDYPSKVLDSYWQRDRSQAAYIKDINVYQNGLYLVFSRGKSVRAYRAVFSRGETLYWFESETRASSSRYYKKILDVALLNLVIDGEGVNPALGEQINQTDRELSIWVAQGPGFWLYFTIGLSAIIILFLVFLAKLSGKGVSPEKLNHETAILEATQVEGSYSFDWEYRLSGYAIYLTTTRFLAFNFGYKVMELIAGDEGQIIPSAVFYRSRKKRGIFLDSTSGEGGEVTVSTGTGRFSGKKFLQITIEKGLKFTYRFYLEDAELWEAEIKQWLK
ncbi:MAG: hypothetical protein AB1797_13255 [bacterium]